MIDRATVQKIAHLARLEITPQEEERFTGQLSGILDYFEQLSELDTENVPPTTRAIEISNITRADRARVYSEREELLRESPEPEGDYFRVPRILNTDEEG
ncbi:Asp-tRNA(Asn)/Glu-tRNA(Gln) amidotransferase subunit GatC [Pannus brasiliensis CCIBt3594]|uniref:Aspartyl/glutamyl-tRNA(Asn/Gln) amidotransferase subunit C n=1 Tax=Pannus brasiliensis CCIBt3594 TaxID=1427578 RepID=A0AAW9QCR0_9CHRO